MMGPSCLKDVTLPDVAKSAKLRILILNYTTTHWFENEKPQGSFTKTYTSEAQKDLDAEQSSRQSNINAHLNEYREAFEHNKDMYDTFMEETKE